MRQPISIYVLFLTLLGCIGNSYFEPKGIVDKTEEYIKTNKGWIILKENERIDGYTRVGNSIFGGEIDCNIEPLMGVDAQSFKVLPGTSYAKDRNHVYYPLVVPCIDYSDCGVCFYGEIIIKSANPETFEYLDKEYAVSGRNTYFRGELIPQADGKTFRVVDGPEQFYFAVDTNYVYIYDRIFKEADPSTFYYDKNDKRNTTDLLMEKYIIGDKNHKWQYSPLYTLKELGKR